MKIENNNGSIRLQFQFQGKRYSVSPLKGARFDSPLDHARAEQIAKLIEGDIAAGLFDPTLDRYRIGLTGLADRTKEASDRLKQLSQTTAQIDLATLWEKYQRYKKPMVSPTTYNVDFVRRVGGAIAKLPTHSLRDAIAIRDWLLQNKSPDQARKILTQFSAACNWGLECSILNENPFVNFARSIRVSKGGEDINPFSTEERDRLLGVFREHWPDYSQLVNFLFFSGCRPSEAIALRISDRNGDRLTFRRSYVEGMLIQKLKTQKSRTIRLNSQLSTIVDGAIALLDARHNPEGLMFPSPQGNFIDWHNFTNRAWRSALELCPDIEYRNPYQTRHSFITEAIKAGVAVADVAKHCGNSPKVIWSNYVGLSRDFEMPSI